MLDVGISLQPCGQCWTQRSIHFTATSFRVGYQENPGFGKGMSAHFSHLPIPAFATALNLLNDSGR
jgi:hypothetical protein